MERVEGGLPSLVDTSAVLTDAAGFFSWATSSEDGSEMSGLESATGLAFGGSAMLADAK